ncbi:NAD(P)/FAD-dependent oxidoreductase [Candidatus Woesearchaeota archaeon]|nr:NAD(P)/FAD-dependent oxidoreductase [Candidatus Woesearchaeota archaeon]
MEQVPITIIGGGVVGCAIAHELSKSLDKEILLIEKNQRVKGENQSSRNSGVIHSGIYYSKKSEPLKARLCVEGNQLLYEFCKEHGVPHKRTGKLVVATNPREEEYLNDVFYNSLANNVPGAQLFSGEVARSLEPNVSATKAAYFPSTGIVEPTELISRLHRLAEERGVMFLLGNKLVNIKPNMKSFEITTSANGRTEIFETELLINSAGLYSDDIACMVNPESHYRIKPILGEWAKFYSTRREGIGMNGFSVYPAPYGIWHDSCEKANVSFSEYNELLRQGKVIRSIGLHLSPMFDLVNDEYVISSTLIVGPTATRTDSKEDYSAKSDEAFFHERIKNFFPNLRKEDLELHQTGIRAKLNGYPDFVIERDKKHPNCINLVGIDSPGLTASLAIAKYVKEIIRG